MCKISILSGNFLYLEMSLVASNTQILTPVFRPPWKIVNDSKSFVLAVPIIMLFKVFKYFSSGHSAFDFLNNFQIYNKKIENFGKIWVADAGYVSFNTNVILDAKK